MLPDIDQDSWLDYQRKQAQKAIEDKMAGFGMQQAIGEKMAGLQAFAGQFQEQPTPPQPAPPEPSPMPEPAPAFQPEPPPQPQPPQPAPQAAPQPSPWESFTQPITDVGRAVSGLVAPRPSPVAEPEERPTLQEAPRPSPLETLGQPISDLGERFGLVAPRPTPLPEARPPTGYGGAAPADASPGEVEGYIRQAAAARGIDPDIAVRVANSEGGMTPARRGTFKTGSSWWPFQLHYGGQGYEELGNVAGMGNRFTAETGYQPGDPNAWQAATDFALNEVQKKGWGQWYGAQAQGITGFQGVNREGPSIPVLSGAADLVRSGAERAVRDISQFGDSQLSNDESYAACGPAAAVRFAQRFGRNPTLREAVDLAKEVGWSAAQGMAGIGSEQSLLKRMGIETELVPGAQWDRFAQEAQTGNPVTISTAGHYFYADGYNPQTGQFHVGRSGADLRGGAEWMTPQQMTSVMGAVQGGLLANNPTVAAGSTATPTGFDRLGRDLSGVQSAAAAAQQRIDQALNEMESGRKAMGEEIQGRLRSMQEVAPRVPGATAGALQEQADYLGRDIGAALESKPRIGGVPITTPQEVIGPAVGGAIGRGIEQVQVSTPGKFLGERWQAFTEGPGAGPLKGLDRNNLAEEQLRTEDPTYGALVDRYRTLAADIASRPPDAQGRRANDFELDQLESLRDQRSQYAASVLNNWDTIDALARRNPDYEQRQGTAGMAQSMAAALIAPETIAGRMLGGPGTIARNIAGAALDPQQAPFSAFQVASEIPQAMRAGEALGVVSRTGTDTRPGLAGYGELGTLSPREQLPNFDKWEATPGARYMGEGESGYHPPPVESAQLVPGTEGLPYEDRVRQVIADLVPNERIPRDLIDPQANDFADAMRANGASVGRGEWTPEQTVLAAAQTRYSQGRGLTPFSSAVEGLGEDWSWRQMPSLQTQGAVPGGKPTAYGLTMRPETLGSHILADTADADMMEYATALGRPSLEELGPGADPAMASFRTRAERQAAIERGADRFYELTAAAGQGGDRGDRALIKGAPIERKVYDEAGNWTGETKISYAAPPGSKKGRLAWGETIPQLHQTILDWGKREGKYAGLDEAATKAQLLEDLQNARVAGIGIDKAPFVANMGFSPEYGILDLRMRRQVFGLSPKAKLTRAERNVLEQKLAQAWPNANSDYVSQWLPWAYLTDEKTDYTSIGSAYSKLGEFSRRAEQVARESGRPMGEVVRELAQQTPRIPMDFPRSAGEVVTRIGISPKVMKNLPPGTSGQDLRKAMPELEAFRKQAGVEWVGKPSVGTGRGIDPDGNPIIEPAADVLVRGPKEANRYFGASWLAANTDENSAMLAHVGEGLNSDSLGTITLRGGASERDVTELHDLLSEFSPDGWHISPKIGKGAGEPSSITIGGVGETVDQYGPRFQQLAETLRKLGYPLESTDVVPAEIEFLGHDQVPGVLYGGPRGAVPAGAGGAPEIAGAVGAGGPAERAVPTIGRALGAAEGAEGQVGRDAGDLWRAASPEEIAARPVEERWAGEAIPVPSAASLPKQSDIDLAMHLVATGQAPPEDLIERLGPAYRLARGSAMGAVAGAHQAAEEEDADLGDVLQGALTGGALGAGRAQLRNLAGTRLGLRPISQIARAVEEIRGAERPHASLDAALDAARRTETAVDRNGYLNPKLTTAEQALEIPGKPPGASQIYGPRGELLSSVAPGGIASTARAAEVMGEIPKAVSDRMPNLKYIAQDNPDIAATLAANARIQPELIDAYKRGTQKWDDLIHDVAKRFGMTKEQYLKTPTGKAFNEAEQLALRATAMDQAEAATEWARRVDEKGGVSKLTEEEKVGFMNTLIDASRLQAIATGGASTAGRTLNQQKIRMNQEMARSIVSGVEQREAAKLAREAERKIESASKKAADLERKIAERKAALADREAARAAGAAERRAAAQNIKDWQEALKAARSDESQARRAKDIADKRTAREAARQQRVSQLQVDRAKKALEAIGPQNVTDQTLQNFVNVINGKDPVAMGKFLRGIQKVGWGERANIARYAGMLSATYTHGTQAASNLIQLGLIPATHAVAVPFDILAQQIRGGERTRYWGELPEMLAGAKLGMKEGLAEAAEMMRSGVNVRTMGQEMENIKGSRLRQGSFGFEQTRIGQAIGQRPSEAVNLAAEAPLRAMSASDLIFRGAARGMHTRQLAARKAIGEGYTGKAVGDRVGEIMSNLDEHMDLVSEADTMARRAVLQEESIASKIPRSGPAGTLLSVALPFVRTPYNLAAQGAGMTPLGYFSAMKAIKEGRRGEAVDRVARATFGTALMIPATMMAAEGHITGAYPEDQAERSTLPPGWRPWSFRVVKPDGEAVYVPLAFLGPVSVPMAMAAVAGEAVKGDRPLDEKLASRMVAGAGRFMVDQSMLLGFNNAINAIIEPDRYAERYIESLATQVVPYSGAQRQLSQILGIGPRDPNNIIEALEASFIPTMLNVRARTDPLGREVPPGASGIGAAISPLRYSTGRDEPLLSELRRQEVGIPRPAREFRNIPLSEAEQRAHQEASGRQIEALVREAMADPRYQQASPLEKQAMLQRVIERARAAAAGEVLGGLSREEAERRVLEQRAREAPVGFRS